MNISSQSVIARLLLLLFIFAFGLLSVLVAAAPLQPKELVRSGDDNKFNQRYFQLSQSKKNEKKSRKMTLSDAIDIAVKRHPGKVLSAKQQDESNGGLIYRIKILSKKGDVRTVLINANDE